MHDEDLNSLALTIACKAGTIEECDDHAGTGVYLHGSGDLEAAYRLGNAMITDGRLHNIDRRALTDAIKCAVEIDIVESCPYCEKRMLD